MLLVLGCVLAPLAVFSVWLNNRVTDTDQYVETVAPLSKNKAIDAAVADKVTSTLFARVDVVALAREALPPKGQFLAGPLAGGLRSFTQQTTERVLGTEQFHRLWKEANRLAHRQVVALVTGEDGGVISARHGKVVLDLRAVTRTVQKRLAQEGVTIFEGVNVSGTFELVDSKELEQASDWVRGLGVAAIALPALVIVSFAGALWLSPDRRSTLVAGGIGLAVAMAVMSIALYIGRSVYLDGATGHDVPRDAAAALFDTFVRFLRSGLRTGFALGVVVAAGAWVTGPAHAAVWLRTTARRALTGVAEQEGWDFGPAGLWVSTHKRGLRFAVAALGAVILVWSKRPGPRGVVLTALGVLVCIAVIEVVGRVPRRAAPDRFT
jgi:hypothetical protein